MERKINGKQLLFFISYGLYVLMMLFRTTFFYRYFRGTGYKIVVALCIVLIIVAELLVGRGKRRFFIALAIALVAFGIPALFSGIMGYAEFFITLVFIFSARDIPFRKIAKFTVIILLAFLAIIIVSSQVGIIEDFVSDDGRNRHYLGFNYALFPATISFNLTLLWIYIRKNLIHWYEFLIILAADIYIYVMTDSRLSFYLSVFAILIGVFLKLFPNFLVRKKIFKYILSFSFVIFAAFSLFVSYKADMKNKTYDTLNQILSGRIVQQHKAVTEYGFSLFGQPLQVNGNGLDQNGEPVFDPDEEDYFYVDNYYVSVFVGSGFVFFLLFLAACTFFTIKSIKYDKKGYLWAFLVLLSLFCVIQDSFMAIYYNTFILSAGNVLFGNLTEDEIDENNRKKVLNTNIEN